jgi:hypothetical protein
LLVAGVEKQTGEHQLRGEENEDERDFERRRGR